MEGLQFFLLVLQIILAISLIIIVLIQKSEGDALSGIGGGSGGLNSAISGKAKASILTKVTLALIAAFMINSLLLSSISKRSNKKIQKELEKVIEQEESSNPKDSKTPSTKSPKTPIIPSVE